MPEGDTIFRAARALGRALGGKTITGFRSAYPLLTRFHEDHPLTGRTVDSVESRGKWVLMHFSGGATLVTHMLMKGSWHIYRPGERWQAPAGAARIVIETSAYVAVGFNVPVAEIHTAETLRRERRIPAAEGDLLSGDFDPETAVARIRAEAEGELGDVLLRQRVMAGVGNVFKSEVCYVTGLNPFRKVGTLTDAEVREVVAVAQQQLAANVMEDSGNQIVTWRGIGRRTTRNSDPTESLWVYGRAGEPCRKCGTPIERRMQGKDARVTYWCPQCQPG
ncbi:MAG TPA: DNA-formamidopyrimidine glycosylase family protein [Terracidiphilus sp.]|jgi:endonuclease-8